MIAVIGATCTGKTQIAFELAKHFSTSVISADSRQFYKEMNAGTAKPLATMLDEVKHYFINNLSIHDTYNAGKYAAEAEEKINELFREKDVVLLCGGSTLYLSAFFNGIDAMPEVSDEIRAEVKEMYTQNGLEYLQKKVKEKDIVFYQTADVKNPVRLMRAIEVMLTTGKKYSEYRTKKKVEKKYTITKVAIDVPRAELYRRIELRCDEMLAGGLLAEVQQLVPYKHLPALQTIGYTEFFNYYEGRTSLEEATSLFRQHTRNYAKRQLTWFRREEGVHLLPEVPVDKIVEKIIRL